MQWCKSIFTSLSIVKYRELDEIKVYVAVVCGNSATELPLAESSLMVFTCRDLAPDIYYNSLLFTAVKREQKHQQEKNLHLFGTSKVYPYLPRWKNHNFIFFFQTYSRFNCHHGVKGVY